MAEIRMSERRGFSHTVEFEMSAIGIRDYAMFRGEAVDISPDGLGLLIEYPLVRGMVVRLSLPVEAVGTPVPVFAEVSRVASFRNLYRAGLRFLK